MKTEIIPDNNVLFRRATKYDINPRTRKLTETAFMIRAEKGEKALSVNWEKYATAQESAWSGGQKYCVGGIKALVPRNLSLDVVHKPSKRNKAHSLICGDDLLEREKNYELAGYLAEACELLISTENE